MPSAAGHPAPSPAAGRVERLFAAAFTPAVLFVVTFDALLFRNIEDLGYDARLVAAFAALFVAATAVAARWIGGPAAGGAPGARLLFAPGLFALAIDAAASWSQGPQASPGLAATIDSAALALAMVLVVLTPFPVLSKFLAVVAAVTLAQETVRHLQYAAGSGGGAPGHTPATAANGGARRGNVYHILLDGFQREVYEKLKADDPALALPGFTYYSRFTVQYGFTMYAVPNILHGRPYLESESFHDWQKRAPSEGFWKDLDDAGIQVDLYPHWDTTCPERAALCHSNQDMLRELGGATASRTLVDLWFLGFVPGSVRRTMLARLAEEDAAATGTTTLANLRGFDPPPAAAREHTWGAGEHHPLTRAFSITNWLGGRRGDVVRKFSENEKLASLANFERFLEREADRPGHGRYVFVHANVPHPPFFLDRTCAPREPEPIKLGEAADAAFVASILDQSTCAMRLAARVLDRLRELGRLEDSLVIFHSDHGHDPKVSPRLLERFPQYFAVEWDEAADDGEFMRTPKTVGLRSHALLLLRAPQPTAFTVSQAPAQTIDLAPTVLGYFGLSHERFPGTALQNDAPPADRETAFYGGEPWQEFFTGGGRDSMFPSGNRFSKFVLDGGRWRYRSEVPVH